MKQAPALYEEVWAAMGGFGWSAAEVIGRGPKWITLRFTARKGDKCYGKRKVDALVARSANKRGADKPRPPEILMCAALRFVLSLIPAADSDPIKEA